METMKLIVDMMKQDGKVRLAKREDLVEMVLFHCYNEKESGAGRVRMDDERGVKRGGNAEKETSHWD